MQVTSKLNQKQKYECLQGLARLVKWFQKKIKREKQVKGARTMGMADAFEKEDRVPVKMSTFHAMMKEVVKAEFLMNAVICKVPHEYIYEMATGTKLSKEQEHD